MTPQFTPRMLRLFLIVRAASLECEHCSDWPPACERCQDEYLTSIRLRADVSEAEMSRAIAGTLVAADPRERLWRALDLPPEDVGIRLLSGGKQEEIKQ